MVRNSRLPPSALPVSKWEYYVELGTNSTDENITVMHC